MRSILFGRGTWMKIELYTLLAKPLFWELKMLSLSSVPLYDQYTFYDKFIKISDMPEIVS